MYEEPAQTLLRLPAVQRMVGLGRSQIYNLIKNGGFPAPIKLSERCSAWIASEVGAWVNSRIAASRNSGEP